MIALLQALAEPPPPLARHSESGETSMGESDEQQDWIVKTIENLKACFAEHSAVHVSGDQCWYPVERNNRIVQAPDTNGVFVRFRHRRGCSNQVVV